MSILIKGMEMPTSCASCDIACRFYLDFGVDGLLSKICRTESRRPDCPLIPVLDHGDLIDRDALERNLIKMQQAQNNLVARGIRKSRAVARDLPTIIPADRKE